MTSKDAHPISITAWHTPDAVRTAATGTAGATGARGGARTAGPPRNAVRIKSWDVSDLPRFSAHSDTSTANEQWPADRYALQPCLSPDGRMLACVVLEEESYPRAVQVELDASGAPQIGTEREVRLPIQGAVRKVLYSPSGHWLACEVAPDGGEREQIWAVTNDPSDDCAYSVDMPSQATVELVCWDGEQLAVSAYDTEGVAEGRLINPDSGDYQIIDRRMGGKLIHVRNGYALFRVGARGNRELLAINPEGEWRPLLPVDPGSTTDAGHILDAELGADGALSARTFVRSDHSSDRARLLEIRSAEGTNQIRPVAEHDNADLDTMAVSLDNSTLVVLWNRMGRSEIEIYDLNAAQPRVIARPELPAVVASTPSLTADGSLLALTVAGFEFPPRVMLYDVINQRWTGHSHAQQKEASGPSERPIGSTPDQAGQGVLDLIADPAPMRQAAGPTDAEGRRVIAVGSTATVVPELHRFAARDGVELSGWLYRCSSQTEPGPVLVYLHGGPEGQHRPDYNNVLRKVVLSGISVFAPNIRGSAGNGRWFSHADDKYGRFAGIDDVEDCLDYVIEKGIADPSAAIVSGRSYGGYLVHATLTRHAGRWLGGIATCGMSNLETFYRDTEAWIAAAAHPKYGHPQLDRELLRELSPLHDMHRVRVPVLFIHGANDTNVPVTEAYQAMGVLSAQGVPNEILFFDDEGHAFEKLSNRRILAEKVTSFCRGLCDAGKHVEGEQ